MRILPAPWEGTHPAFPKPTEPTLNIYLTLNAFSTGVSAAFAGLTGFVGLYRPGLFLQQTGALAVVNLSYAAFRQWAMSRKAKEDVYPLLEKDGIPRPKFKLVERTKSISMDDYAIAFGCVGFARSLLGRRLPSGATLGLLSWRQALRSLGGTSVGFTAGYLFSVAAVDASSVANAVVQDQINFAQAKLLWQATMGKEAPDWLYGKPRLGMAFPPEIRIGQHIGTLDGAEATTSGSETATPGLYSEEGTDTPASDVVSELLPTGTRPHVTYSVDGKLKILPMRDYMWIPASPQEGIELLQEEIKLLNETRTQLVEAAEYIWLDIARRERELVKEQEEDSPSVRLRRKALEFLSSCHQSRYSAISDIDWILADTKKMMLQLQRNGEWVPERSAVFDPTKFAPTSILELLRLHKQTTEANVAAAEQMLIVQGQGDLELESGLRDLKENDAATSNLIKEYEKRVENPASFDDT